jgi:hypothetical protein
MHRLIFSLWFLFTGTSLMAKEKDSSVFFALRDAENKLKMIVPDIVGAETDEQRTGASWLTFKTLDSLLQVPESFDYPWDSLRTRTISIMISPDKKVKFYTWNLVLTNGNFKHFGFLQVRKRSSLELYPLLDTAKKFNTDLLDAELETADWFGALYYKIVPFKQKGQKRYLLMGFDGSTIHSNKSVLDVLWFAKDGPRFGIPAFRTSDADPSAECRVVYEFHNDVKMLPYYEANSDVLIVDKLTPAFPEVTGNFWYYIPSGDFYMYKKNKRGTWVRSEVTDWDMGQGEKPEIKKARPSPETDPANR